MITLITGMPGAGKTAAMVDLLSKLCHERPVFVHFDAAAKRRAEQTLLHETLQLPHQPCDANTWWQTVPDGGILVIDEVQDVWRPRGPGVKVPEAIAQLEVHRHAGIDVYLTTQSPRLLDANVRALVGRHVHIRDTGFLGRYWYEWPELSETVSWRGCVNKHRYKLPKASLGLYKSANVLTTSQRRVPVAMYVALISTLVLLGLLYAVYRIVTRGSQPADKPQAQARTVAGGVSAPPRTVALDDRVAFVPRISNRPETAPAYDHLRQVVVMPVVSGAICIGQKCVCYTQQATDAGLSSAECAQWARSRPFNPYAQPPQPGQREGGASREEPVSAQQPVVSRGGPGGGA